MGKKIRDCQKCGWSVKGWEVVGCRRLKDWLEPFEIAEGKTYLKDCPYEKKK